MNDKSMSSNVKAWPKSGPLTEDAPRRIMRPCDYGLRRAVNDLETQLGTIEAYNRLAAAAHALKARIDAGDVKAQNPIFAASLGEAVSRP